MLQMHDKEKVVLLMQAGLTNNASSASSGGGFWYSVTFSMLRECRVLNLLGLPIPKQTNVAVASTLH